MSAPLLASTDAVAVGVTVVATLVVVALAGTVVYLLRTVRELRHEAEALAEEAQRLLDEVAETARQAGAEVQRVDRMVASAEAISEAVGSASRLVGGAVAEPVIKAVAFASGLARVVQALRRGRPVRGTPAISYERQRRRPRGGAQRGRSAVRRPRALARGATEAPAPGVGLGTTGAAAANGGSSRRGRR